MLLRLLLIVLTAAPIVGVYPREASGATVSSQSDRSRKLDLLARAAYRPRLVFFGGSRSLRIPPSFARSYVGLRAFNLAVQECRAEDAWALAHHLVRRDPDRPFSLMWGLQPNIFWDRQLDVALVRDARLKRYFPADLLAAQGNGMRHTWANRRFAADGHVVFDNYDRFEAQGRTLKQSLDAYVRRLLKKREDGGVVPPHPTRAKEYFRDTLGYLNRHGCAPLLVIMPIHPRVIKVARNDAWDRRRDEFRRYLVELQATYDFTILDFTFISRFNGDRSLFYDGVHMKEENCRRLLQAAMEKAPWAFGLAPAPWESPHGGVDYEPSAGWRPVQAAATSLELPSEDGAGPTVIVPAQ